jgi:peptide/nickel transport system permease protein
MNENATITAPEEISIRRRRWEAIKSNRTTLIGLFLTIAVIVVTVLAPVVAPYDPDEQFLDQTLEKPGGKFLLGTDQFGRDLLSRILFGSRTSVTVGITSILLAAIIGVPVGILAGYRGRWMDQMISRIVDTIMSFPTLLIGILVVAALGPGLYKVAVAIGVAFIPRFIRLARGSTLAIKEKGYVLSAKSIGASDARIIFVHCLPNILGDLTVMATLWVAVAIRVEASLSFLGIGVQPPMASWGAMVGTGVDNLFTAPWISLFPGLAILLAIFSFNLLGDGIRDVVDPKLSS